MAKSWFTHRGFRLRELDKKSALASFVPDCTVHVDEASLAIFRQTLARIPGGIEQALLDATEKTRLFLRREIVKGLKERSTLTTAYVGKAVRSQKARLSGGAITAEIRVASKRFPLGRYLVNPQTPPSLAGIPVHERIRTKYQISPQGGTYDDTPHKPKYAGQALSALFVQQMNSSHIGVFYRIKSTKSVVQQYGPNLQYFMHRENFIPTLESVGQSYFLTTLENSVKTIVQR